MASPFPGMDPYLEHPAFWPGVHNSAIAVIRELLVPVVRPRYWVNIEERVYVEYERQPHRAIRPDVTVSRRGSPRNRKEIAVAPRGYVQVEEADEAPVRETYLTICELPSREVVTVIELLSPTNKAQDAPGSGEYLRKRSDVLSSQTSLVEIDLLREGERPPIAGELAPHDYLVLVHRGWERPRAWARGWRLREPIPNVPIPLLPSEPSITLDVRRTLGLVYERGGYDAVVDYGAQPVPKLAARDRAWSRQVIARARG